MSEGTKFNAVVTGISNKVADKLVDKLKLKGIINWKPTIYNINLPPEKEQEQVEQTINMDDLVERAAQRTVELLLPEIEQLVKLPESERLKAIAQTSASTAVDVSGELTWSGDAKAKHFPSKDPIQSDADIMTVPSTDLPKKSWPSNGEEG